MRVWHLLYFVGASFARDKGQTVASKARSYRKISAKLTLMGKECETLTSIPQKPHLTRKDRAA